MNLKPKILVIRQLALGDVILLTPVIEQIWRNYSGECLIDVITCKPEVFSGNPFVNEVRRPDDINGLNNPYDVTYNFDMAYEKKPLLHIVDAYAVHAFGSSDALRQKMPKLFSSFEDVCRAKWLISSRGLEDFVVVHMRKDGWQSRNLPMPYWEKVINCLLDSTSLNIVQVGSLDEYSFNFNDRLIDLRGQLSIHVLRELISHSRFFVGVDSGTLHIAATTHTPIIGMFTSAHHLLRMPMGRPEEDVFIPLTAKISCYGCQSEINPPITSVICSKGDPDDPPCIHKFSLDEFGKAIRSVLESFI